MKQLFILCLLISTNAFSQEKTDSIAILQLLKDDYKTLANWDVKSHTENCTENYLLIEDNEIWDLNKENDHFRKNVSRVVDRKDYFDIKYLRIYGNFAYAVYHLKSDILEKGNLQINNWVESAIFRKIKGKWRIELINSTPLNIKK